MVSRALYRVDSLDQQSYTFSSQMTQDYNSQVMKKLNYAIESVIVANSHFSQF